MKKKILSKEKVFSQWNRDISERYKAFNDFHKHKKVVNLILEIYCWNYVKKLLRNLRQFIQNLLFPLHFSFPLKLKKYGFNPFSSSI